MHSGVGKVVSSREDEAKMVPQQAARNIKLAPFGGRSYNKGSSFGFNVPQKLVESYKADEMGQGSETLESRCFINFSF